MDGTGAGRTSIVVVGAGPAGIAAGITAHRLGVDVVVIDKARFPRDKTCGDGLTAGALRQLAALDFDPRALASYVPVTETVLVAPGGHEVHLLLPGADGADDCEHAAVVTREELDAALVAHARTEGVEVREGVEVHGVDATEGGVALDLGADGTLAADWVIAGDGHWSTVRRALEGPTRDTDLGTWHAFRQYFSGVHDERLWVLFEEDLLPGYAWIFPLGGGRVNVGIGVLRDRDGTGASGKELAAKWRDVLGRPHVRRILGPDATPEGTVRAWPIPATYDQAKLHHGRVLFVGDAAHVVDPMTGEGIAQALETGTLAARAIAFAATPAAARARYVHDVEHAVGTDLRFARLLQGLLRTPFGVRACATAADLTPWTRRHFARWMFEDYPRALLTTPSRWHRGMFTPTGAYAP